MFRRAKFVLNLILVLGMLAALSPGAALASRPGADSAEARASGGGHGELFPPAPGKPAQAALQALDPELRQAADKGGDQMVKVTVLVKPGANLSRYFDKSIVRKGVEFDRVIGLTRASNLLKLASAQGTLAVLNMGERPAPDWNQVEAMADDSQPAPERIRREVDLAALREQFKRTPFDRPSAPAASGPGPDSGKSSKSFYTNSANGVFQTWASGTTGDGQGVGVGQDDIKIAIIDSGIDFANPDLFGTQARIMSPTSAYFDASGGFGWPIAFDDRSMSDYALDVQDYRGNWGWYMNTNLDVWVSNAPGEEGRHAAVHRFGAFSDPDGDRNTPFYLWVMHPDLGEEVMYQVSAPLTTWNRNGGLYRFGWHPDDGLAGALGITPGVLLSDENWFSSDWDPFDTIYVDIMDGRIFDGSYPFNAWATLGQETACVNLGWSAASNCDISGGMVYYISNGSTPVPASDWIYGMGNPEPGAVVAFMLNDYTEGGGEHGMLCAGAAIGQGQIVQMPYAGTYGSNYWPPAWYDPSLYGGISQGTTRDSRLVAMGNYYQGGSSLNFYDFTALGYDGIPAGATGDNHDQPHMSSNSYGSGGVENDGWDLSSRYVSLLNRGYVGQHGMTLPAEGAYSPLFVGSSGNSGFGYGTVTSPSPETALMVGSQTVMGQYNLGDTALYYDWVNWGHLTGFSDRGPNSMSSLGVHVLANGFYGNGNYPLNYLFGGDRSVDFWSGTSRSGPEVMGIAALVYDAYYEIHGTYPTWYEARNFIMNGARTIYNDPKSQGAGMANAWNSVEIVRGTRGVQIVNEEGDGYWYPGDYRGTEYPGFARGLFPGQADEEQITLVNHGSNAKTIDLETVTLEMYDSREWDFTSLPLATQAGDVYYGRRLFGPAGSNPAYGAADPFYIQGVDDALVQDADLMVVRLSWPYEQYLDLPYSGGNWWFLYAYAWRDTDASLSWFNDVNGNGVMNGNDWEVPNELVRMNYDYHGNSAEVRIREPYNLIEGDTGLGEPPLAAMTDIVIMPRHFYRNAFDTTDLKVTVELYKEVPWVDQIELSTDHVVLGSYAALSITAAAYVPLDEPPGEYTGYIKATCDDPYEHSIYFPVEKQVWFPSDIDPMLGGVDQPGLYDNGVLFGATGTADSGQREESGDWRFFYTDVDGEDLDYEKANFMLAHTTWNSTGTPPNATDIDTLFYGPMGDTFSSSWPAIFGPSSLSVYGGSLRSGSAPDWQYYTTSGGPDDWSSVQMYQGGLYGVAAQVTRWGGENTRVPFQINVGSAQTTPYIYMSGLTCESCTVPITFKTNHSDLEGESLSALAYGFTQPVEETLPISQDEFVDYYYTITAPDAYMLQVNTYNGDPGVDVDLTVYYNDGGNWVPVGDSGRSDSNEQVVLSQPAAGEYRIEAYGFSVAIPTEFRLEIWEVSGAGAMTVTDLPTNIALENEYTLHVNFTHPPEYGLWYGAIFLGPAGSPTSMLIPVLIDQGEVTKTVEPEIAYPGDLVTYTLTLHNSPNQDAYWYLNDSLPPELEVISVDGADYNPVTHSLTWANYPLFEGFESGFLPAGWSKFFTGTLDNPGFRQGATGMTGLHGAPHSGSYFTWHNDDKLGGLSDSWLVAPQVHIPMEGGHLNFFQRDYYQDRYNYHGVWVTTDASPNPALSNYQEVWSGDAGDTWENVLIDLSSFAGQDVYLAFRYQGYQADEWYIDDVEIKANTFDTHVITVVMRVPLDLMGVTLLNTAYIETGPNVCPVEALLTIGYRLWLPITYDK